MASTELVSVLNAVNQVILGKSQTVKLALSCLLAQGHLLIEDLPGLGKTTLAHTLAKTLGLEFQRIQFTSDMLPADIVGVSVFDREASQFKFHPGPIFNQLILADEINRATPRAQSALLEVMEEQQVSVDGITHVLPNPFFVIATQNPSSQLGTFPLPESQLDRFLMRIKLGYPDEDSEKALLKGKKRRDLLKSQEAIIHPKHLIFLQNQVTHIHVADSIVDYVHAILSHTRDSGHFYHGLSPRAGLDLLTVAQAWAMVHGRDHVLPEDVQAVLPGVVVHRLQPKDVVEEQDWINQLIDSVAIP